MLMMIVVTRDVPDRFRGFLASCMLEIAPGVYTSPNMSAGVRRRIWLVIEDWYRAIGRGGILITWPDRTQPSGQAVEVLGWARRELVELDGIYLAKIPSREGSLKTEDDEIPF